MSLYLLDSDSFVFLLKGNTGLVTRVQAIGDASIGVATINAAEVLYGAYNSANSAQSLRITRALLARFQSIPLDNGIADKYGEIRADLRRNGTLIPEFDILVGASAIVSGRTLVTNNIQHLARLSTYGMTLENWKS